MPRSAADNVIQSAGVLIVGAGLAGLFAALKFPGPVTVLSPVSLGSGASSTWAQGGIAAALGNDDSAELHARDTEIAGAGIVDAHIARLIAREATDRIYDLADLGVPFDRDTAGKFTQGREAAHSRNRIVRVTGDRAGAAIMATLIRQVKTQPRIQILEGLLAYELAMENGRVVGVYAHPVDDKATPVLIRSHATVFALGGVGGLFEVTTNPPQARGQGLGMAARAGALIADPEFIQFHPTAIAVGRDPAPLATEALRGEGATLVNDLGDRFMPAIHKDAELAPRDIVARAIFRELRAGRRVFLDATKNIGSRFPDAFPTVFANCQVDGIDPRTMPIPVAPAAHYHMGGISVDENARTTLPGLWAIGECASTGAHGANRLASNSLLEAIVFGARAASDIALSEPTAVPHASAADRPTSSGATATPSVMALRKMMTSNVGLERCEHELIKAIDFIAKMEKAGANDPDLRNMTATCLLIAGGALRRKESRGGHYRNDFPETDPAWATRTFVTLDQVRTLADSVIGSLPKSTRTRSAKRA
ncbi:MAG: L-aspartate oxidase [Micropepsaceae bacterium]